MGPKTFTACYVCLKEFGSKSIALHEPLCLKRWRASNKTLPADKRSSTPVKNADKNQNNPSWVCSHCQAKGTDGVKTSSKRKSSSPKQACAKLVKSERGPSPSDCTQSVKYGKQCAKSTLDCTKCGDESISHKQVRSDCTQSHGNQCIKSPLGCTKCCDECPKQVRSDYTKSYGKQCTKSPLDCTKCGDESISHKQVRSDCTQSVKCSDQCLLDCTKRGDESRNPKQVRSNCTQSIKCSDQCLLDCTKRSDESRNQKQVNCTQSVKCCDESVSGCTKRGNECKKYSSHKPVRSDRIKSVHKCSDESVLDCTKRSDECTKYSNSHKPVRSVKSVDKFSDESELDCTKLGGDEYGSHKLRSSDCANLNKDSKKWAKSRLGCTESKNVRSVSVDRLKGLGSPKEQPKSISSIPKQVSSDCVPMTGVAKPEFSPKKGKENKNNNSNHIPPPSVARKNAKNDAKSSTEVAILKEDDPVEISSTSRRSVRPQTKILRRPTPNLNHPVIQQVDSDDSSGGDSDKSSNKEDDNPKRLRMGEETAKPKNFIAYNKNNVDRKLKSKDPPPKERNSATMQSAIPNPCNSCNRSLAPERLHSHAKKDSRGLMYRKSPTLDVKMGSPQKKLDDVITHKSSKVSKLPKAIPVTPDQDKQNSLQVPGEESSKSSDISSEDVSSSEEKDLVDLAKACYICQEEFKVSALLLHESKCLEIWKKTNNSLTPNLRKLPPRRPDEEPPEDPVWTSVQSQLVPCPSCGRTFFPERLPVHRRVCKGKPSPRALKRTSSLREHSASSSDGDGPRPAAVYVPCYVCGRNYGSWVITMHEQQCIRRWRGENQKLPDEEQKEEPTKPERQEDEDVTSLVELGDNAWESHLQQLVPCPLCTRTFFPDRLGVHKRSCKGPSNGARRPKSNKGA